MLFSASPLMAKPMALYTSLLLAVAHFSNNAFASPVAISSDRELISRDVAPLNISACCLTPLDATAFALIYGFPLQAFVSFAAPILKASGVNAVQSETALSTPQETSVVKPNVDTLYSYSVIDLSSKDVIVTVPPIPNDRYWDFAFYDLFGNNFANVGVVGQNKPGNYLVQRAFDVPRTPGLRLTPNCPNYIGRVNFPTTYGSMLVRILIKQNTTAELNTIHGYQNGIKLATTPRLYNNSNTTQAPPLLAVAAKAAGGLAGNDTQQLLELLALVAPFNPPIVESDTARVNKNLALAGISNGTYTPPLAVAVSVAAEIANKTITAEAVNPVTFEFAGNNWVNKLPQYSGNFGTFYADRAVIANLGYLELVATQQLYPVFIGTFIAQPLGANQAYLLTFSGLPPIAAAGYWSVTAYNGQQFLIPNALNRYELGDRSNLTYPDGSPVYGPSAPKTTTTPFKLLIQPANLPPPANWTSNWLPAPAGGGALSFLLRWGAPTPAFTNGSYAYPQVVLQNAITAN